MGGAESIMSRHIRITWLKANLDVSFIILDNRIGPEKRAKYRAWVSSEKTCCEGAVTCLAENLRM